MRNEGLLSARGLASAFVLAIAGLALGWVCLRTAIVHTLSPTSSIVARLAPDNSNVVLARGSLALVTRHGLLDVTTLRHVRRAAAVAPLDARAFLILGHQQLVDGQPLRAVKSFEAGQKLNPRNRLINVFLLERYLLTNRFAEAATQMSLLARLVHGTQSTIATVMAQMVMTPDMRGAVRQALKTDPLLERAVLTALAKGDSPPNGIFALASPKALADAGNKDSWGPVLISRLVDTGQYNVAHSAWRRIYQLSEAATATPIFNASFRTTPASPPFNWILAAGSLGAADPQKGTLAIDYYGRDSGDLASQLLVLSPGRYRFSFVAKGGKPNAASQLFWTLACVPENKLRLMNVIVPMAAARGQVATAFKVPEDCPAQTLTLRGEAGEFPSPINLTIDNLAIRTMMETKL